MAYRAGFFGKDRNASIIEHAPNEINRTTQGKGIKTLESVKKEQPKDYGTVVDDVRDFLQDTNNSVCSDDGKITNNTQRLEKRVKKQQYLVNNDLFDPSHYFGGLEISNLEENIVDQRLDDMFLYYLPTEMEEKEGTNQPQTKPNNFEKPGTANSGLTKPTMALKPSSTKNATIMKENVSKGTPKVFTEILKEKKEVFSSNPLSPVANFHKKGNSYSEKNSGQVSAFKNKNPMTPSSNYKFRPQDQVVNASIELKHSNSLAKKRMVSDSNGNKENKASYSGGSNVARHKSSMSVSKTQSSLEFKGNFRTFLDMNSNPMLHKSTNTSLLRNNRSTAHGSFSSHNRSLNNTAKTSSIVQNNKIMPQNSKQVSLENTLTKEEFNNSKRLVSTSSTKVETQNTGRSKTKSTDRHKDNKSACRNRKDRKNFSSFASTLSTEEEPEFLFKSYNTLARPRTANPFSSSDDHSSVLKGILSPKMDKSLLSKPTTTKSVKKVEKAPEPKLQVSNPLKFLNDLLNKRKISYSSSDHLRMPKKPTFLENKVCSLTVPVIPKHPKSITKSDLIEAKISSQVVKKTQRLDGASTPTLACSKKLFNMGKNGDR